MEKQIVGVIQITIERYYTGHKESKRGKAVKCSKTEWNRKKRKAIDEQAAV